jgi:hypothetical protein
MKPKNEIRNMSSHVIPVHVIEKIGIYLRNQDAEYHATKPLTFIDHVP